MKIKTKIKTILNFSFLNKILFVFALMFGVAYVAVINDLTVKGFELQKLKSETYRLEEFNRSVNAQAMSMKTFNSLSEKAVALNMVNVGEEVDYIVLTTAVVAQR